MQINELHLKVIEIINNGELSELIEFIKLNKNGFNPNYVSESNDDHQEGLCLLCFAINSPMYNIESEEESAKKLEIVKMLVENGAEVNEPKNMTQWRETPLHDASVSGLHEIADFLIKNGANINALNYERKTPIDLAIEEEDEGMLKKFGFNETQINEIIMTSKELTLIEFAAIKKDREVFKILGFDEEEIDEIIKALKEGKTIKEFAEEGPNENILEKLGYDEGEIDKILVAASGDDVVPSENN